MQKSLLENVDFFNAVSKSTQNIYLNISRYLNEINIQGHSQERSGIF